MIATLRTTLTVVIAFVLMSGVLAATDRYVATTGNNANPGTAGQPWATIAYAVANSNSGDVIHVAAGVYTITARIDITKTLTIQGPQAGVDPRPINSSTRTPGSAAEAVLEGSSVATIFRIAADDVIIEGLDIRNTTGDMIESQDVSPVKQRPIVRYNILRKASDEAVQLRRSDDAIVEYNFVDTTTGDAINICCNSTDGIIRFNEVTRNSSDNAAIYIYDDGSTVTNINILIQGNIVHDVNNNDGIKLGSKGGNDVNDVGGRIIDNKVYGTVQDGISVYTSGVEVDNNEIYSSSSANGALYVSFNVNNVTVTRNYIHDNTTYGVRVGKASYYPTNVVVNNCNRIQNNSLGGLIYNFTAGPPQNGAILNAEDNYWGSSSGPFNASSNPGGTGNSVSDNVDFQPFQTAPCAADTRLPVELSMFNVDADGDRVVLSWRTASEIDNAGFEVYRADDGEEYTMIASYLNTSGLQGLGTSSSGRSYRYNDGGNGELVPGNVYWYRIADVSSDGIRTMHTPQQVLIQEPVTFDAGFFRVASVAPNPAAGRISVVFNMPEEGIVTMEILNTEGRSVAIPVAGDSYGVGLHTKTIDVQALPAGQYMVRVTTGVRTVFKPVTVVR